MHDHSPGTVDRARKLRREMSLPEALLWRMLKPKPMGLKFRNQHPLGDYVVDFYCHTAKTAFEIDGISHDMGDQAIFDTKRIQDIGELGVEVVRFPATEVLRDVEAVANTIIRFCLDKSAPTGFQPASHPFRDNYSGVTH